MTRDTKHQQHLKIPRSVLGSSHGSTTPSSSRYLQTSPTMVPSPTLNSDCVNNLQSVLNILSAHHVDTIVRKVERSLLSPSDLNYISGVIKGGALSYENFYSSKKFISQRMADREGRNTKISIRIRVNDCRSRTIKEAKRIH